jgi:potassium/hydrogen antiporter
MDGTYSFSDLLLIGSVIIFLCIFISKTSSTINVPSLLIFIGIGMLAGAYLPGIYFNNVRVCQQIGIVALIFILFSGGLDANWAGTRPVLLKGGMLSTLGVFISTLCIGYFAYYITDFTLTEGLLLGAIVSSTDAAAVFSILKSGRIGLKGKIRPLLELESGSNDPMAYFLTIAFITLLKEPQTTTYSLLLLFCMQMAIGAVFGFIMGRLTVQLLNRINLPIEGLYAPLLISIVFFIYSGCEFLHGNGFLAVYISGMILGNSSFIHKKSLIKFYDAQAWLLQIIMFIVLGLLVFPNELVSVAGTGILVSLFLIFVARPLAVFITLTLAGGCDIRDRLFVSWVGLRGAVPIIFATYPLLHNLPKARLIFNIVFFIVFTSVLIQGSTVSMIAKKLRLYVPTVIRRRYPVDVRSFDEDVKNDLVEISIGKHSKAIGKTIMELGFPENSLIALIERRSKYIPPKGETRIEKNDRLFILTKNENELDQILRIVA